jgi:hypothetical protein
MGIITNFVRMFKSRISESAASMFLNLPLLIVKPTPKKSVPKSQRIMQSATSSKYSTGTPATLSTSELFIPNQALKAWRSS